MARLWSDVDSSAQVLVTSDGETWDPVAMPPGVSPNFVDLGDQLWVVTGWDNTIDSGDGVYVSSDEGATWQRLELPGLSETSDSYLVTRGYVGSAAAFGDQAVVTVSSFIDVDVAQIAIDQGIATSPDEVLGWGTATDEDNITSITIDVGTRFGTGGGEPEPVDVETFTFTPDEIGLPSDTASLYGGPDGDGFTIFVGDAAGLAPVADLAGNPSRLLVAGDELLLSGFTQTGATVWTSGDGITWTATDVGDGFEMAGRFQGDLWGGGWSPEGFVVERFDSAGVETVATFPGLNLNSLLSAGPSGLAATVTVEVGPFEEEAFPVEPFDEEEFPVDEGAILEPGVMASQNGIDLRVEEDGTGTLIDTNTGEILREFTEAEMNADDAPAGVVETDDGTTFSLRIEDPETGEELVTFSIEDYTQGFDAPVTESSGSGFSVDPGAAVAEGDFFEAGPGTSFDEGEFIAPENWIAWSSNGTDWNFQRSAEAFGLNDGQDAWTQIAVGDGYVIAMLESFTEPAVTSEGDGDFFPTIRWFRAETG